MGRRKGLAAPPECAPKYHQPEDPIVSCGICTAEFRYQGHMPTHAGLYVCPWCRGKFPAHAHIAVFVAYVQSVSRIPCLKVEDYDYSRLGVPMYITDCKCLTCAARKVIRITASRRPSGIARYHPSSGMDRLAAHYNPNSTRDGDALPDG